MDLSKIFIKDCSPTKMGGQAVMSGIMMRGDKRMAVAIRQPDGKIHIKTEPVKQAGKIAKLPLIRGVISFFMSLVQGMRTLMYSADVLEKYEEKYGDWEEEEPSKFEKFIEEKFGERAVWNVMLYTSLVISLGISIVVFVIGPTAAIGWLGHFIKSSLILNLIEGFLRLAIFIVYIAIIARMKDIHELFQYHGAEHKCIHCFENDLELTPENCKQFYTLHPRCGTSFIMFVLVISIILFSLLGWPTIWLRIVSRLALLPVIAGLSYELLKWAGRSDNIVVKILSMPGLWLQMLTTAEPERDQLEVAIASIKAVRVPDDTPYIEGICDLEGKLLPEEEDASEEEAPEEEETPGDENAPAAEDTLEEEAAVDGDTPEDENAPDGSTPNDDFEGSTAETENTEGVAAEAAESEGSKTETENVKTDLNI